MADGQRLYQQRRHRRAFGDRLRQMRHERGWTQEQLAEASGLDRSYLSGAESGTRNVSLDAIMKIAGGLEVAPAALFDW